MTTEVQSTQQEVVNLPSPAAPSLTKKGKVKEATDWAKKTAADLKAPQGIQDLVKYLCDKADSYVPESLIDNNDVSAAGIAKVAADQ